MNFENLNRFYYGQIQFPIKVENVTQNSDVILAEFERNSKFYLKFVFIFWYQICQIPN